MRVAVAALALALVSSGCSKPAEVPIFLWHSVGEGSDEKYDLPAYELDEQLSLLEEFHATVITLEQLQSAEPLPKRAVVLTFDDGRQCLHDVAMPLLQKHQMVATAFIVTGWTKDDAAHRYTFEDDTGRHPALVWPEVEAMANSGAFRIGSHSAQHAKFGAVDDATQTDELRRSRDELARHLKTPSNFFAYPYGSLGGSSKTLAKEAGYDGAVTVAQHAGGPYARPRISVWRSSTHVVRAALVKAFGDESSSR